MIWLAPPTMLLRPMHVWLPGALTLLRTAGGELSSCSQLDTNRSAQLLDAARSLGEDEAEAAAATAVAATAAGTSCCDAPTLQGLHASRAWGLPC